MLLFFLFTLLTDVKFTSEAFVSSFKYENLINSENLGPLITVAGTVFAYFSIVIISFGDFSRYVKNEKELKKGNLSLILNLIIFSFFAFFIVTGVDAFSKEGSNALSRILTNPTDIARNLDSLDHQILIFIFIILASASTNLIVNYIPSQYSLINFLPDSLSLKSSSLIISILGLIIGIFWVSYLSQIGILSFIDTFGSFFGPLAGVMIIDYYFTKKGDLINKDNKVKIFVCCDEKHIEDDLVEKAPNNIIVNTKNSYVKKAVEGSWRETVDAGDGRKQDYNTLIDVESAREAFIDLLILSRTNIKYRHKHSSFSWFSEIYSNVELSSFSRTK